jgi:hypothetical protein
MVIFGASVSFGRVCFGNGFGGSFESLRNRKKIDLFKLFECPWETEGIFVLI